MTDRNLRGCFEDVRLRPRDFQFSIARLMVATTVCAVLLAVGLPSNLSVSGTVVLAIVVFVILLNDWSAIRLAHAHRLLRTGNYRQAIANYTRAIAADPDSPERYCYRGTAYFYQADYAAAIQDYTAAIHAQSRYIPAWIGRATAHYRCWNFQQAIDDATVVLCLAPGNFNAVYIRGGSYLPLGELDAALTDLDYAIGVSSSEWTTYYLRANTHYWSGNYKKAIDDFKTSLAGAPGFHEAAIGLALARFKLGNYRDSMTEIDAYLHDHPQSVGAMAAAAWCLATCPEDELRDGKRALELAERARQLATFELGACLSSLAAACAELNLFDRAIPHGRRAVELALPVQRAEWESRLAVYEAHRPYRDMAKPPRGNEGVTT